MLEIYAIITAGITGLIGVLYAMVKVKSAQAERSDALAKVAKEEFEAADKEIKATEKMLDELYKVKAKLAAEHKIEQARVDEGHRDHFNNTDL